MSPGLKIPESGLSLHHEKQSGGGSPKSTQFMRLNLVQSTMDELIEILRNDQPARVRLGKHPSLHYAGKSQAFHAYPETHRSEIYHTSTDGADDRDIYFTGVLSHSLEVEKAKQDTAATDQALANLEESLNAFERGKESKKTHIIHHPDEFKALRAAGAGSSTLRAPKSKADLEKDRFLRAGSNRSLTSSPTLGGLKSPMPMPTSAPSSQIKNQARLDALKTPFIHLLAVRAVSTKFLSRQTCSNPEDCDNLAQKYAVENRLNHEKFDLRDKIYKDLDVWKFPYPNQEDRQQAIENAVSAFDRLRISRSDKLWQMLLSKEERGKGKCLSRLNLNTGPPVKKTTAPRIQVDGADDRASGEGTGNEADRPSFSSMGLDGAPPRSIPSAQKSRAEKEPAKRPVKAKPTNNSTLTGRVTKKTGGKAPAKVDGKFKSAEFVHSSDDDEIDMSDAAPPPAPPAPRPKDKPAPPRKTQAQKGPAKTQAPAKRPADPPTASKAPKADAPTPKLESSQYKSASKKPVSRQSTSPQKPSPLGSSPPTNASDVPKRNRSDSQNQQSSSSSSSSPLISQLARANKSTAPATTARVSKPVGQSNGVTKSTATGNPLKRKAEPVTAQAAPVRTTGNLDHKRRRAVSASSGGSTGSASPPMSYDIARQRLSERSQIFKRHYAKYRTLHKSLEAQANPSQADLDKLVRQHEHLQSEKREIWEEDRRLREGILS
ncbi:hypothetical protein N7466_007507 [Penicillium verhagenii]|uniref:uncharacterized protein n=1 Tax=Penicillium verhagenii TaxID=1562060 RepID=UPI0025458903|nr:uncharacterized protein N7466_007507 [Penicillium verhagenii]KAJ5928551.1 hypothetical protein N7466_007507 [Penicillium verhagenii]